ncbi:SusC/RagA family TonB-linked outer membrane protein [Spirosoma endbachense]|uniref:SusC/RagA family TonB-linked outer membrane protein n=1 Tax=Spirosoma endbachense TaxID=2666025 RepID=A0A6P1W8J8_9BACT|nr:SusC/RagA family TonB-linked outer membrane protein [Spirosoma endbachense]QHW00368.1 SusC/RagA family TonB-linked outer membrane protein [Spirosoma endbachense]
MKRRILIYTIFWLSCFFGIQEGTAQLTFASVYRPQDGGSSQESATSIIGLLKKLELTYRTTFVYQKELLENKTFSGPVNENDKLEQILERVLTPANLRFRKLKGGGYTILPRKSPKNQPAETELLKTSINQLPEPETDKVLAMNTLASRVNMQSFSTTKPADILIKGKVTESEKGEPIPGASIVLKGATKGTNTDANGAYSIAVPNENAVLVFSFVGFEKQEITVGNRTQVNVALKNDLKELNEVVVVGFGTQKKINATGAISTIGTKELIQSPVANISNSLVGRLPGLFATQSGGEPGNDGSKIRIRGVGTFSGSTDPLTLVDGIQVDNYNNIDPNEIESVTILKDASSTAVYGIRGANGVLIITTKRGKVGPPKVSYTFNQGFNSFTDLRQMMNSGDYATHFNDAIKADAYVTGTVYVPKYTDQDIELYRNGQDPVFHPNVNWFDVMFKKVSKQSQHNVNISGGQNKVRYFVSAGYFSQEGLFKDTKDVVDAFSPQSLFQRYNLRSNFNFDVTSRLRMTLDLSSQTEARSGNNGSSTERVVGDIARASPLSTPGVVDGKVVNILTGSQNNPYASLLYPNLAGGLKRSYRNYLNGNFRLDYDLGSLIDGLSVHGNVAMQTYNDQQIVNTKTLITYLAVKLPDGTINYVPSTTEAQFGFNQTGTYNRRITAEAGIDYKRNFGAHNVTGLLLYNQQKTFDPSLAFLVPKGYQSFVGRATYDYKGRYLAEVNVGYNGTENFAPGKRFGFFPAYSLGWVASQEPFFPKAGFVTFLKVRGSYGEVGNDNIGGTRFLYRETSYSSVANIYYFGNVGSTYSGFAGIREGATGNPDVTWERAVKQNIGLELWMWKDKIKFTADVFNENRSDILATPQTISSIVGLSQPASNLGKMENKGYEGDITYTDKVGSLGYRISANFSFARNKVLFRDEVPNQYPYQNRTGQRLGQNFGLIAEGLYNTWEEVNASNRPVYSYQNNKVQPGDIKYKDYNGDGVINNFDAVPIGYSNLPEKTFGASIGLTFKGFDLSVLFQGVGNVSHYYTRFQRGTGYGQAPPEGSPNYMNESWTQERYDAGLPIQFPRFSVNSNPNGEGSSYWLADASYVRIKNAEIGYRLTEGLLKKLHISACRIYVNANNLYTWKHMYPGIDPENTATGDTNTEPYPLVRTINTGINLSF